MQEKEERREEEEEVEEEERVSSDVKGIATVSLDTSMNSVLEARPSFPSISEVCDANLRLTKRIKEKEELSDGAGRVWLVLCLLFCDGIGGK
ncbi:hypothetical protein E2C01_061461 [Portunus trituberculatus]|uniref:Uncharacterized protein n=1 Tax=Portunus trituberculatus TaxID=210409 RepID=A0A5B7HEF4_PORTR|nr:hypothetical protein [Portunus trituberculatus]